MNKYILSLLGTALGLNCLAQANISPAPAQDKKVIVMGAKLHTGNGNVIENSYLIFEKGKITGVGDATVVRIDPSGSTLINASNKHIYPGFIAPVTNLGLVEISSVKATMDYSEIGELNPHIRALVAYNTDSKVPATIRSNGVLMAQITPQGGTISGSSSVVQLDAWNWEDAAIRTDDALHLNWPVTPKFRGPGGRMGAPSATELSSRTQNTINQLDQLFAEAKAYAETEKPAVVNARLAAMRHLFDGTQKLFITANAQKDIISAVKFAKKYNITPVLVEGDEAYLIIPFLKENNISVVVKEPHNLPIMNDDDVNMPYKNAGILANAGINVAMSLHSYWQLRNLPFMAGTVAAWGLDKEKALQTITLNTAKVLGIDKTAGSLEIGKDATFFISDGDALDMKTNKVEKAFIQGRDINLDNLHKQLDKKFSDKYNAGKQ
ncbi:imidazolonepropionase-like amidohydrolase [Pedobacter africanus]|uniref:Imidazolonepropionase-like amidohydrolase n=1 Tax=Pedobacter africanus TaxID=151894 RepID=A0ACC6KX59_9SPHI|nr:amidohydrolase family protein [Pedobacter africanus]MDR6783698.1 imidazolonepropionase-like amidohydrolase [Pedobacter africanus]